MAGTQRPNRTRGKAGAETKAGRDDWIAAALALLGRSGIDAVRVEPLAEKLGVTKGSFYWHFKDRDALHMAMLDTWRAQTTANVIARIEKESGDKAERLERLVGLTARNSALARVEVAMRAWAKTDQRVATAVAEIDNQRIDYMTSLLLDFGIGAEPARLRARILYLALIGALFAGGGRGEMSEAALWAEAQRLVVSPPSRPAKP